MPLDLRRCERGARRASLACVAILTAVGLLFPAAANAGAGRRADRGSVASEEAGTNPPEEAGTAPPVESGEEAPATTPPAEEGAATRRQERDQRRERRRRDRHDRAAQDGRDTAGVDGCAIELQAAPSIVTGSAPVILAGSLSCPEAASAADQTITLYGKLARTPGFAVSASATTEADGAFAFEQAGVEVDSVFYAAAAGAESARTRVEVDPQVTLSAPSAGTQLPAGTARAARAGELGPDAGAVTFTGTVSPAPPDTTVTLQREHGAQRWVRIGGGEVDADGEFSVTHTFYRPGKARIRVLVHPHGLAMRSVSEAVTYEIARRHTRPVSIQASANPIAFGGTVTITGKLAGAGDEPVTLMAETGDGAFAPVAQSSSEGGAYSFAVSPLQSTRYRVIGGHASSAILAETVTYSLSATPSPTSVEAGAQLSFTGTLAPLLEGQPVDLESLSASGRGYRVIASAAVSSGGEYSIAHAFATAGTQLLRIYVPANGEIGGVAGETFELEVKPAT